MVSPLPRRLLLELRVPTTPCLLLDEQQMDRNIARLKSRLQTLRVSFRPHLKTAKSVDVARRLILTPAGPATVSTLKEAEEFSAAGITDLLYAVGITPDKLTRVVELRNRDVDVCVILDSIEQAQAVVAKCRESGTSIPVLIEIDCDGHRAGVQPGDSLLIEIGRTLHSGGAQLRGVMTHAGGSYDSRSVAELELAAERERAAVVRCAEELRSAGLPSPIVSVGSTPTAHFAKDLSGVTEVRAGVFVFFDLVMAGIGVCSLDDIAVSVLATVIGHRPDHQIIIDAGWMALSRDRGTANQRIDYGYGLVCDEQGRPFDDLIVGQLNQEHGIIESRRKHAASIPSLPIGSRVRILPNHACAAASQHEEYVVVREGGSLERWPRIQRGW
jgi:D-serine deaminase-like pyridoxal phosphate-dependent protein